MDASAIPGIIAGFKSAKDILTAINSISKNAEINQKVIELQNVIMSIQMQFIELKSYSDEIIEKNKLLIDELKKSESWVTEKDRFEMVEASAGVFLYKEKGDEVEKRFYCTKCFDTKQIRILQQNGMQGYKQIYGCNHCRSEYLIRVYR